MLIAAYLAAIVAANLVIAAAPAAVIPVGLILVGLDLVARDRLHDRWATAGPAGLAVRMAALIAAGGAISYALNADAGRIALASVVAFTAAATVDSVAYQLLAGRAPRNRSTLSNVPAALVDSVLFLALAFPGPTPWALVGAQFAAKAIGGAAWAAVLYRRQAKTTRRPRTLDEAIRADLGA